MNTYYHHYKRSTKSTNSFPALRKSVKISSDVRYDNNSRWIGNVNQRRCGGCHKTTKYFCKKCNVTLHPKCFKIFH